MVRAYNLIGAKSRIAKYLYAKLKNKNYKVNKYTHSNKNMFEDFIKNSNNHNINIYFSIIRDDLNASKEHLEKFLNISKKNNANFFYISSINAKFPEGSLYSKIKYECEKIVKENNGTIIRLGLVTSEKPFGPYNSIIKLSNSPINFIFSEESKIITTNINKFLDFDYVHSTKKINEIFSNKYSLNKFMVKIRKNKIKLNINLTLFLKIIFFINNFIYIKGTLGRLLTLTCIKD